MNLEIVCSQCGEVISNAMVIFAFILHAVIVSAPILIIILTVIVISLALYMVLRNEEVE